MGPLLVAVVGGVALLAYEVFKHNPAQTAAPVGSIRVPAAPLSTRTENVNGRTYAIQQFAPNSPGVIPILITGQAAQAFVVTDGHNILQVTETRGQPAAVQLLLADVSHL